MSAAADTIVAPATPAGTSALALIRVSGPRSRELADAALGGAAHGALTPRVATHRDYADRSGHPLDDVVATLYVAPQSYTGEDLLEISTHGNPLIVQRVVEDLVARGCRLAEPGEFTRRAFLSGRMDLAQAEAVMDVIHAQSEQALAAAQAQLKGALGRHLARLTETLINAVARVEAYIDFPEEDLPAEDRDATITAARDVLRGTERLLATRRYGDLLRRGLRTVIVGETNAGKSTLLNALLGHQRALVSDEPGTTRDYLEEPIQIGRHSIRLVDTAGLNLAPGAVERMGITKTLEQAEAADLLLLVFDATRPFPTLAPELAARARQVPTVVIMNKWDAVPPGAPLPCPLAGAPTLPVSALHQTGLERLIEAIAAVAESYRPADQGDLIAINARHAGALQLARESLQEVLRQLEVAEPAELVAANLRSALNALGEIVGPIEHDRILDRLFAEFCIGK